MNDAAVVQALRLLLDTITDMRDMMSEGDRAMMEWRNLYAAEAAVKHLEAVVNGDAEAF